MSRVVKLTRHYGQYRITLPGELVAMAGFKDVEYVKLSADFGGPIIVKEYHGKDKEKRDLQKD